MNLMIDLETLSTRSDAVIVTAGFCIFDKKRILGEEYLEVDYASQMKIGRHVDPSTVAFWMRQSNEVRQAFLKTDRVGPELFLEKITALISQWTNKHEVSVWSNGSAFDVPIIEDYLGKAGLKIPWKYTNVRCYRTFNAIFKCSEKYQKAIDEGKIKIEGAHHNALADARWQASAMIYHAGKGKL